MVRTFIPPELPPPSEPPPPPASIVPKPTPRATPPPPEVVLKTINPSATPGGVLGVTGEGCTPNSKVEFSIDGTVVGETTSKADGTFEANVDLPVLDIGRSVLHADCGGSTDTNFDVVLTTSSMPAGSLGMGVLFLAILAVIEDVSQAEDRHLLGAGFRCDRVCAPADPDGTVRAVVFPVASLDVLSAIVREYKAAGTFERQVHAVLRASYAGHYRRMLPAVLSTLSFHSNNAMHRPVIEAIGWLKRFHEDGRRVVRLDEGVPFENVIPPKWRDLVLEKDRQGNPQVNCINYEICVLTALRERLRCKEIWVAGAEKHRNPDEDLPGDFEERRAEYYRELGRDADARAFTMALKSKLTDALAQLNRTIPFNPKVRICGVARTGSRSRRSRRCRRRPQRTRSRRSLSAAGR